MTETQAKTVDGIREIAEKGVAETKANFNKVMAASEEGTDLLNKPLRPPPKAPQTTSSSSSKLRANATTAFDYAHEILAVKSAPEFVELSTAHVRKQFEVMKAQTKELAALAQKMTTDITAPIKTGITKAVDNSLA